jgi:ATP-dependent DNA ligase
MLTTPFERYCTGSPGTRARRFMTRPTRSSRVRDPLPHWIEPQLTQLVEKPPSGDGWAHEIKYDGYRLHLRLDHGNVRLMTRSGLEKYDEIRRAAAKIAATTAYIDGEP